MGLRGSMMAVMGMISAASVAGCSDQRPSEGDCSGSVAGQSVAWVMDPDASHFYRDDLHFLQEEAFFDLSYADADGNGVAVAGKLADMPTHDDVGSYDPVTDPFFAYWWLTPTGMALPLAAFPQTLTLSVSGRDRLEGIWSFDGVVAGAVECSFDLRRAYELDTDD